MEERLKISSDISQFFKYSAFPVVTIGFAIFALLSYFNGESLVTLELIPFILTTLIICFVNPYRKLVDVVVDFAKQTFIIEGDSGSIEFGMHELEKYSIGSSIVKLHFRNNKEPVSFLLPMSLEYPPRRTVIKLLKEAVMARAASEGARSGGDI